MRFLSKQGQSQPCLQGRAGQVTKDTTVKWSILNTKFGHILFLIDTGKLRKAKDPNTVETKEVNCGLANNLECSLTDYGTLHSTACNSQEESSSTFIVCEEDWDNDIANHSHVMDNNTRLVNGDTEPSTYSSEKNFYLGVTGNKHLFCEETSSTHSSDSEAWTGSQSQSNHETSYQRSSLHLVSERDWLDELESLYFSDLITELKQLLSRAFEASKNCFDFVLYVVKFADFDIQSGKKSLSYITLIEFEAWLKSKTEGRSIDELQTLGFWPTDKQKDLALDVVVSSTFLVFEPIKRTFQLDLGENGFLTKHVRFLMHSKRRYKEVS